MLKFKFFTLTPPSESKETNEDGSMTSYQVNNWLNAENIQPVDVSAEYNENTGSLLLSIGYKENKSIWQSIVDFVKRRGEYQIRFAQLTIYSEKAHTVYIQLELENAVNYNEHENISHGIYVEKGMAHCAFLEYRNKTNVF